MILALTDMQGRLQGKRFTGGPFPRRGPAPRRRGVQLPARRRRRDEHRRRLRDELVGARLRRLRDGARPRDAAPHAVAAGHGAAARRRAVARPARRSSPPRARSCAARSSASRERGWTALAATELELLLFRDLLPRRAARRLPRPRRRPTSTTSTTRSSAPRASSPCCAASATRCSPPTSSSRTPRASATSASTRSTSSTTRRSRRPTSTSIYKNGAKEIADQEGMSISFMAKFDEREGNSCHVHLSLRDSDGGAGLRRPARGPRRVPRGPARDAVAS